MTRPNVGPTSTAVMYDPGRILQVGGNGYFNDDLTFSSRQATIIDIRSTTAPPVLTEVAPMANARQWANATVLPTGKVFVNGGTALRQPGRPVGGVRGRDVGSGHGDVDDHGERDPDAPVPLERHPAAERRRAHRRRWGPRPGRQLRRRAVLPALPLHQGRQHRRCSPIGRG